MAGGAAWLERLPRLADECAERWSLRLDTAYSGSNVSLAVRAELPNGSPAVLKLNFPEPESQREPDALAHWSGEGAVRLLATDPARRALLVERCEPGTSLWSLADDADATRIAAQILRRLWRPPLPRHAFVPLARVAIQWADSLAEAWDALGRPFERRLLEEALAALAELGPAQGETVVLHQDFHGGNVLRAQREPWLAIDPKPLPESVSSTLPRFCVTDEPPWCSLVPEQSSDAGSICSSTSWISIASEPDGGRSRTPSPGG